MLGQASIVISSESDKPVQIKTAEENFRRFLTCLTLVTWLLQPEQLLLVLLAQRHRQQALRELLQQAVEPSHLAR